MNCPKCGAHHEPGDVYCWKCGYYFVENTGTPEENKKRDDYLTHTYTSFELPDFFKQEDRKPNEAVDVKPEKKPQASAEKKRPAVLFVLLAVIVLAIILVGLMTR